MDDSDLIAIRQNLYLTASRLEETVKGWLRDVDEGRRAVRDGELAIMRELLEQTTEQKHRLADK